ITTSTTPNTLMVNIAELELDVPGVRSGLVHGSITRKNTGCPRSDAASTRKQRVEAASLRGQPVFFRVIEPWTRPERTPGTSNSSSAMLTMSVLGVVLVVI